MSSDAGTYALGGAVLAMPFSITLCHGCLIAFLIASAFDDPWTKKIELIKRSLQLQVLLALSLLMLIGVTYSQNEQEAWFSLEKKVFFILIPLAIATSETRGLPRFKILTRLFCVSCFFALIICYTNAWQQWQLFEDGKLGSAGVNYLASSVFWDGTTPKPWLFLSYVSLSRAIAMHPTYLAMYCAFCCVIMISEHRDAKRIAIKALTFIAILFFSISIIFLSARVIIVLLGVICLTTLAYESFVFKTKLKSTLLLALLLALLVFGVIINPVTKYRQVDEIIAVGLSVKPNTNYTNSTAIRTSLWWLATKAYLDSNLVIGTGQGDVQESVRAMGERHQITNVLQTYDPHSQYLFFLLSSGIIGLVLFLWYIGIGFRTAWQNRDTIFLSFVVLFSAVCVTETVLELQKGIVFFSIFFSLMSFGREGERSISLSTNLVNARP